MDTAAFQDVKVSLLLLHACEDFARGYRDRKVRKNNCKFEFRPNCKQRLISDNKFMSVDAGQFFGVKIPKLSDVDE